MELKKSSQQKVSVVTIYGKYIPGAYPYCYGTWWITGRIYFHKDFNFYKFFHNYSMESVASD